MLDRKALASLTPEQRKQERTAFEQAMRVMWGEAAYLERNEEDDYVDDITYHMYQAWHARAVLDRQKDFGRKCEMFAQQLTGLQHAYYYGSTDVAGLAESAGLSLAEWEYLKDFEEIDWLDDGFVKALDGYSRSNRQGDSDEK